MSVQSVITFEVGGEVRWLAFGTAAGIVCGGSPVALLPLLAVMAITTVGVTANALHRRAVRVAHLAFLTGFVTLMAMAVGAPYKWDDERVHVSSSTLSLAQLATELKLEGGVTSHQVTLPSSNPTWREVKEAIEGQTPYELHVALCWSEANLLRGGHLLGPPTLQPSGLGPSPASG